MMNENKIPDSLRKALDTNDLDAFCKALDGFLVCGLLPIVMDYLNELTKKNPESMRDLCEFRVPLQMPEDDPLPIKVAEVDGEPGLHFGLIGIINGLLERIQGEEGILLAGTYDGDKLIKFSPVNVGGSGNAASLVPIARKIKDVCDWIEEQTEEK